jgi:hypothetical protein
MNAARELATHRLRAGVRRHAARVGACAVGIPVAAMMVMIAWDLARLLRDVSPG